MKRNSTEHHSSTMGRRLLVAAALACLVVAIPAATEGARKRTHVPRDFFGIAPQSTLTPADARRMKVGGIDVVRWPVIWSAIQPVRNGGYDWSSVDQTFATAARAGLKILPVVGGTPAWLSRKETTLPIGNARQRSAWRAFLNAAVKRYGPRGRFWREARQPSFNGGRPVRRAVPAREWQIWNEANFFYFTFPVSPARYARFVIESGRTIKRANRGSRVILAGLFGEPTAKGRRGMPAATFLNRLYSKRGIKRFFDGVALHPYAYNIATLRRIVESFHRVTVRNRDRVGLYITEMGWGSEANFKNVAFEQGPRGQVRQLRAAYRYLMGNQRRLNLRQVHWFSWKDISGACDFCDSVGLFHEGAGFRPKPAWHAFVRLTGGRARP